MRSEEKKGRTSAVWRPGAYGLAPLFLCCLGVFGAGGCAPESALERVILVTIDTLRADHVGVYGAPGARTPVLDAMAVRGTRFETAVSPAPLTLPSHATLMTGLDPHEHGVRHNGVFRLGEEVPVLAEALRARGLATGAFVGAFVLDRRFGLARGFDHYDDRTGRSSSEGGLQGFAERTADQVVDAALAWLETVEGPFFLWVHFYDPHADYQPPPGFAAGFANRLYDGEIAFADAELGRLVRAVEQRFADGATLFVVTSDHGESLGEHGEPTHSHTVYDATQRVPLVFQGPGVAPGHVAPEVVALRDVAPTVLERLGAEPLAGASGRSLGDALAGGTLPDRPAYVETLATQLDWGWSPLLGLRTARHKVIAAPRPELYDLDEDPGEREDVAARRPGLLAELLDAIPRPEGDARRASRVEPGEAERRQLEALGYVVPASPDGEGLGRVGGIDPKDRMHVVAAVHEADDLLSAGRPEAAWARLEATEGLGEEGLVVQAIVSSVALAAGRFEHAEAAARAAVAGAPQSRVGLERLAAVQLATARLDDAAASFRQIAALDPAAGGPHTALGTLAEQRGDRDAAAAHYRDALAAPHPDATAGWRLAALALEDGHPAEARALLEAAGDGSEEPEAALRLARAEAGSGRTGEALARLERAAAASPGHIEVRIALAETLLQDAQGEAAADQARQALAVLDRALGAVEPVRRGPLELQRARALALLDRRGDARASLARALSAGLPWPLDQEARRLAGELGVTAAGPADS